MDRKKRSLGHYGIDEQVVVTKAFNLYLQSPFVAGGPTRPRPKSSIIDIEPLILLVGAGAEDPSPRLFNRSIELFIPKKNPKNVC